MTSDKGILIKNIYYMLTYAFQSLRQSNYDLVAAEEFENIHDMFAAILGKGVASQLKQGLSHRNSAPGRLAKVISLSYASTKLSIDFV